MSSDGEEIFSTNFENESDEFELYYNNKSERESYTIGVVGVIIAITIMFIAVFLYLYKIGLCDDTNITYSTRRIQSKLNVENINNDNNNDINNDINNSIDIEQNTEIDDTEIMSTPSPTTAQNKEVVMSVSSKADVLV